ncbi:hypothetical protein [Streptomyces sp. NBC_01363]|uniref:hypothetical protein n=1 Tax=Streptomyces sp. NBC_01363 TaxID=2903840 RepID=UPI00225B5F57|nr:hypothetical protein [Streptomyces sp. NBC_01363]MCX4729815.1 hypothetical protein [Streptomyces sp. NBC_01363]
MIGPAASRTGFHRTIGGLRGLRSTRTRLQRLIHHGDLNFRCDIAHPLAGPSTMVIHRAAVPHAHLEHTGNTPARMEQVRMCVSVSGPHNLPVIVRLHGLNAIGPFEMLPAERFPMLEVKDRTVAPHSPKRMGWLLDTRGRATRRIPLDPPRP